MVLTTWKSKADKQRFEHVGTIIDTKLQPVMQMKECLNLAYQSYGTRYEGQIASAIGPTRHGKTSGAMLFMQDTANSIGGKLLGTKTFLQTDQSVSCFDWVEVYEERQVTKPIICIGVAPSPTYNGLLFDTIYALTGTTPKGRPTHAKLLDALITQLLMQKVRLVIFDEAHRICREGGTTHNRMAADVFTTIAKKARVEIVVIGREELRDLAMSNEEFEEMNELVFEIGPLPYPLTEDHEFAKLVGKFERQMPFDTPSNFGGLRGAQLLHRYTKGAPGALSLVLQTATKYGVLRNQPFIDLTSIGNALKAFKNVTGAKNIFLKAPGAEIMDQWANVAYRAEQDGSDTSEQARRADGPTNAIGAAR